VSFGKEHLDAKLRLELKAKSEGVQARSSRLKVKSDARSDAKGAPESDGQRGKGWEADG
jgi:hypothetical protein